LIMPNYQPLNRRGKLSLNQILQTMLVSSLLLLPLKGYATTEFISTLNKTGEDYTTIGTWEAAMDDAGDIKTATNLVLCGNWDNQVTGDIADATAVTWNATVDSGTLIHMSNANGGSGGDQYLIKCDTTGECDNLLDNDTVSDGTNTFDVAGGPDNCIITLEAYNDDGSGAHTEGAILIDGLTTDATNYMKMTVPSADRHDGTVDGGGFSVNWGVVTQFAQVSDSYFIQEWFVFGPATYVWQRGTYYLSGCANSVFRNSIHYNQVGIRAFFWTYYGGTGVKILNNIMYDGQNGATGSFYGVRTEGNSTYVYNNSIYNTEGVSYNEINNTLVVSNSIGDNFDAGIGGDYNISIDDASSPGANSLDDQAATDIWVDVGSGTEDLHLKASGSVALDVGSDLGTTNGVNIDINGRDRDAEGDTWDIGAHECNTCTAGGGGGGRRRILITAKNEGIESMTCFRKDFMVEQEAGKCKIGHRWFTHEELGVTLN
jgi:hypothetical protein